MKRFECDQCGNSEPCALFPKRTELLTRINGEWCEWCAGQNRCQWNEVKNNEVESDPLPKLTSEALSERGIKWPDGYDWCAVNGGGELRAIGFARFYVNEPQSTAVAWFDPECQSRCIPIPHIRWDASDWPSSKIHRPDEYLKVPSWCKVGAWMYDKKWAQFGKITKISKDNVEFLFIHPVMGSVGNCIGGSEKSTDITRAYVSPWDDDKMRNKVGYVFNLCGCPIMCCGYDRNFGLIFSTSNGIITMDAKTLSDNQDISIENGPCGILEVTKN